MEIDAVFVLVWLVGIALATLVGSQRGHAGRGFAFGLLFGPIGILMVLCFPNLVLREAEEKRRVAEARALQLQEEQVRLLRRLTGEPEPEPEPAPKIAPAPPPQNVRKPAAALDDFIPESLRDIRR